MRVTHRLGFFLASLLALLTITSFAADKASVQDPVAMLRDTVTTLQDDISKNHASLTASPSKLYDIVEKTLLPIISVDKMAAMTLGPKWRSASKAQRQEFVKQFTRMLTRTYSRSLLQVSNYDITIHPLRGNAWVTAQQVAVHGTMSPKNGNAASNVTYYLERSGNRWKIYDFAVEGVSFIKNFQAQFQQYSSIQGILDALIQLNKRESGSSDG